MFSNALHTGFNTSLYIKKIPEKSKEKENMSVFKIYLKVQKKIPAITKELG